MSFTNNPFLKNIVVMAFIIICLVIIKQIIIVFRQPLVIPQVVPSVTSAIVRKEYIKNGRKYLVDPAYLVIGCDPFPTPPEDRLIPASADDPNLNCISSIDEPKFVSLKEKNLTIKDEDMVVGVSSKGQSKAYPVRDIFKHEVVNDTVGGDPLLVTYCPLIGGAEVFERRISGTTVEFGVSGRLYNNDLVMYDRKFGSIWLQLTGQAIAGEKIGEKLTSIPSEIVPWKTWRELHPDTLVLQDTTLAKGPAAKFDAIFASYEQKPDVPYPLSVESKDFPPKAWIRGVLVGGEAKAYKEQWSSELAVMSDHVGNQDIVAFIDGKKRRLLFFNRSLDGRSLTFALQKGKISDRETGSTWSSDGKALTGALVGRELAPIMDHRLYWFSWKSIYPDTTVFKAK